ncbi:hypothetical protein G7046_g2595 [Stylonectria norvegica]|nr:hypothetical protein G7046_g2595 [Stylonectria norvegica]
MSADLRRVCHLEDERVNNVATGGDQEVVLFVKWTVSGNSAKPVRSQMGFRCGICGLEVGLVLRKGDWPNNFRILYSDSLHGGKIETKVSGVGLYRDPEFEEDSWVAPVSYDVRWYDPDRGSPVTASDTTIGVMWQGPSQGRHGFPFHEACWELLEAVHTPEPIPLRALYDLCRSLPLKPGGESLRWHHDFGGIVPLALWGPYPWLDDPMLLAGSSDEDSVDGDSPVDTPLYSSASACPNEVPDFQKLLLQVPDCPSGTLFDRRQDRSGDPFDILPEEVCSEIAAYLPNPDFFNARLASRAFWPIFHSQQFWASRFKKGGELDWLGEAPTWTYINPPQWARLYRAVTTAYSHNLHLENRKRIWGLADSLRMIICQSRNDLSNNVASSITSGQFAWMSAGGDVQPETKGVASKQFYEGCRELYKQEVSFKTAISRIVCSTIDIGDDRYVNGIEITSSAGEVAHLGYSFTGTKTALDLDGRVLQGFRLVFGTAGIHGFQCVADGRTIPQWLGCQQGVLQTERVVAKEPILAIRAAFDGFKLVTLSIATQLLPQATKEQFENRPLRDVALWHPEIPGPALHLNEQGFTKRIECSTRFKVLSWFLFGGPGGARLPKLTGISITWPDRMQSIEFLYDSDEGSRKERVLGRSPEFCLGFETTEFSIDGPGGERIDRVDLYLQYVPPHKGPLVFGSRGVYVEEGVLRGLQITTNWGRSCEFGTTQSSPRCALKVTPMEIAAGTTMTGFYINHFQLPGITGLGVISEAIDAS